MSKQLLLPTKPFEHPAMDYAFLRREGIRLIGQMAGDVWTDFNAHDPGITILEQFCYALTDLAYRINYDLPDLLAGEGVDPYQSLYSPAQILVSQAVTLTDLRKVALDVEGVKNVWIEKMEEVTPLYFHEGKKVLSLQREGQADGPQITEPVFLKGLYRVLIEASALVDREGAVVEREVARRLNENRNLCEDFEEISVLDHQDISVLARIEIGPVEDAAEVLVNIYERIAHYFSPVLPFKTLAEMLSSDMPVEEIFEGPLLRRGFLDSDALRQSKRRTVLYTSDLIHEIMQVEGVRAVRSIRLQSGEMIEAWSLKLGEKQVPKLIFSAESIVLEKEGITASIDHNKVKTRYYDRLKSGETFAALPLSERDFIPPVGIDREIDHYHAIQQQFPALYGIGEMGLPDAASPERKGQAKQLQAYLLFFDQLLANYFSQLSHFKSLFSFYGDSKQTYFSQMISDPTLRLGAIRQKSETEHEARLSEMTEETAGEGISIQRKNRFLNHLLSRFSEQFTDYSLILFGLREEENQASLERLIHDKQAFLQNYPKISRERGSAFDALKTWGSANTSGLEERIRLKLGIGSQEEEAFFLIEHILLRPMEADEQQQVPLLSAVQSKDPYSLQLSFVLPNWPTRFTKPIFKQLIEQTIREETPAHLIPHVHWLDKTAWQDFETVYKNWLENRRRYLAKKFGL